MTEQVKPERKGALVTGSSRGIGRAIALSLAEAGMNVCVNSSSQRSLSFAQELARELVAHSPQRATDDRTALMVRIERRSV